MNALGVASSTGWRSALLQLALLCFLLLAVFWRDAVDIAVIWWTSSTFNHCLLIVPIIGWLLHQRAPELAKLEPRPWWPPLLYVAAGGFGWLLGDAAGVAVARHFGLVMMLQGAVSTILGANLTRGLLFPLFYAFFLVPMGEEAVPLLQTITAHMCMWLLALVGIPAHLEGIFISTPNALFRVAEACSGVKFLIAMVALGALVCNLCFKSWTRRALFMLACIVVPIIANGFRAFATIYVGHHGNLEFAQSFDHVIYGWFFFGAVIAIVLAAGWKFFDKGADEQPINAASLQVPACFQLVQDFAPAALALAAMGPAVWSFGMASRPSPVPTKIALPNVPGWQIVPYQSEYVWKPHFTDPSHTLLGRYRKADGLQVEFYTAVYDRQSEGRELVGYGQGAVGNDGRWSWIENCPAPANGRCERIAAHGKYLREVHSFYRIAGKTTGSATGVKLQTLKSRLLGGNQQAVAILVSAEATETKKPRDAISAFVKDMGSIDKVADQMAGLD